MQLTKIDSVHLGQEDFQKLDESFVAVHVNTMNNMAQFPTRPGIDWRPSMVQHKCSQHSQMQSDQQLKLIIQQKIDKNFFYQ